MPGHRKRRQFKQTDAFTRGMVIGLKRAGWSIRQIAADTHLGASTVHRLWRRWLEQGNVAIYRNVGATRVTSARVDRRIFRQAVAASQASYTAILQHVQDTLDHSISTRTISRRLVANGLHSCRPLRRLPLTPPNRRQRLEWCRARSTWMTEWHRVVFSDESRFCLSSDSRRERVWRRRGERSNPAAIVERPTVRQRGIMGTMTAQRYVDDVLRPVTLPYLQGVPNALYQQDNARPHTARISQQALQDVQMLPWPPYSPDLSPIEHVWDIIERCLHALPQPRSEDELWQMVEREWRAIPQDAIRTLIDSLPRRVAACIAVRDVNATKCKLEYANNDLMKMSDIFLQQLEDEDLNDEVENCIDKCIRLKCELDLRHNGQETSEKGVNLHVKMPKLELPTFDGRLESWLSFKDLFFSAVGSNSQIPNIEKLQYLKGQLRGEALRLVNAFPITADNYVEVWQTLLTRYDNPKDLIFTQIDNALRLPKLADDNHKSMFKLLDSCNEIVRTVKVLGYQIDSLSDVFLVKIIQDKLDKTTRKQWELQNNPRVVPSIKDLMEFLEIHAKSLQNLPNKDANVEESSIKRETAPRMEVQPKQWGHPGRSPMDYSSKRRPCRICLNRGHAGRFHPENSIQMVRRWRSWFLEGRQNLHDDERSGRPVTATDNAAVAAVRNVMEADRRVTIDEIIV
ncbi:hypothetical protein LAZ67_14000927 [Cordylochernes scorpioides]|uniref:Transposase n=1 Tax=Cordylochernes scorpioides TaxID=51811 RepID=A0ABY6L5T8_9ARAC|nr:hypothetical protein LAZ67_14000927 [Cordylochernes scorpioides]